MSRTWPRRVLVAAASFLLVACNQNRSDVTGPSAGSATPATATAARVWGNAAEPVAIVESSADEPEGFRTLILSDPRRNEEGQLVGTSPFTVEFDACRSSAGEGGTLYFYFDWDFDHRADVWGTGDACRQVHTYKTKPVEDARGNEVFETNVCIATGDLRQHDPETYVSCREFTIILPRIAVTEQSCHSINAGSGGVCPTGATQFCVNGPIIATSSAHAQAACETCVGAGNCTLLSPTGVGGSIWYSPFFADVFVFQDTSAGCPGPVAGDITDSSPCNITGRWAP